MVNIQGGPEKAKATMHMHSVVYTVACLKQSA